jgi:hypothetical protein
MRADLHYVYGIVEQTDGLRAEIDALPDMPRRPYLIADGQIAALVSGPLAQPPSATRADLLAHAHVLDRLALSHPVLPTRFGTVLAGRDRVVQALTDNHDDLVAALHAVRGRTQFTVRVRHQREQVLRELIEEQPVIRQLRELLDGDEGAGRYPERIHLGELVQVGLAAKIEQDARTLHAALSPHAVVAVLPPVDDVDAPFGGAYLVEHLSRGAFESAAERLARDWAGRARIRLLGPLAPYDFVTSNPVPRPGEATL